jgi:hypothetical protein
VAFTTQEIDNIAVAALDWYFNKGDKFPQTIQAKPMLDAFLSAAKQFPGGKGNISLAVKGDYGAGGVNDTLKGYTHDDTVTFYTPANLKRAAYAWREMHIGLTLTHTELKIDGISVTDTPGNGTSMSNHTAREETVLVGLLEDKLEDLGEQYARTLDRLIHGDGTTDAKALAGIMALLSANPVTGTVGGLDRATYTWWRNRARTAAAGAAGGLGAVTSDTANGGALLQVIQQDYLQLTRYGGKPTKLFCGSAFLDALQRERRANGLYSVTGASGNQDMSVGTMNIVGGLTPVYDPTLDDLALPKRGIIIDMNAIFLEKMDGEWMHMFTPARPHDKFTLWKSITSTGQMCANRLNSSEIIDIA